MVPRKAAVNELKWKSLREKKPELCCTANYFDTYLSDIVL